MSVLTFIFMVIIAMIIGIVAEKLTPFDMPGGWAGAIVAGFVGAWIGQQLIGAWGPALMGFSIVPSLIGAIIFVFIVGIIAELFH